MRLGIYVWLPLYIFGVIMGFILGSRWDKTKEPPKPKFISEYKERLFDENTEFPSPEIK